LFHYERLLTVFIYLCDHSVGLVRTDCISDTDIVSLKN